MASPRVPKINVNTDFIFDLKNASITYNFSLALILPRGTRHAKMSMDHERYYYTMQGDCLENMYFTYFYVYLGKNLFSEFLLHTIILKTRGLPLRN